MWYSELVYRQNVAVWSVKKLSKEESGINAREDGREEAHAEVPFSEKMKSTERRLKMLGFRLQSRGVIWTRKEPVGCVQSEVKTNFTMRRGRQKKAGRGWTSMG